MIQLCRAMLQTETREYDNAARESMAADSRLRKNRALSIEVGNERAFGDVMMVQVLFNPAMFGLSNNVSGAIRGVSREVAEKVYAAILSHVRREDAFQ